MTDTTPPKPKAPRRRWTRIALLVSLGFNLAFFGLFAGLAFKGPPGPGGGMDPGMRFYGAALPEPYRADLGRSLRASRDEWAPPRQRLHDLRGNLAAALTAEPYDPAAVAAVVESGPETMASLGRRGAGLLLEQIGRMDAATRAEYARRLLEAPGGRGPAAGRR